MYAQGCSFVCVLIFSGPFACIIDLFKAFTGPRYNGKYLHKLVRDILGGTRLHETMTNVVIPTFDIKNLQPAIFNSYEVYILYNPTTNIIGLTFTNML